MARVEPDDRDLLADYARHCAPDPGRRRHNWNATLARLGDEVDVDASPRRRRSGVWLVAAGLAAAIGLVGVQAVRLSRSERARVDQASDRASPGEPSRTIIVPAEPPRRATSVAAEPPTTPTPPELRAVPRGSSRVAGERAPAPSAPPPVQPPTTSSPERLALETRLLGRARAAVERHDDDTAIALLRQHAREFPDGALVEDRSAWLAIVQCRRATPGSGASGVAFVAAHPHSPYVAEIRRVCVHDE